MWSSILDLWKYQRSYRPQPKIHFVYCSMCICHAACVLHGYGSCSFLQPTSEFFGQIFSAEGTRPDPKRVTDLQNMPTPTNAQEVRSLLGMANYSSKYIRNYATITSPLRELMKKNVRFSWTEIHQNAFTKLKDALIAAQVMGYFDISKSTTITVDASPVGISAILAQGTDSDYKVITYASRALTDVEKRYSQTEKEALSIV